MKVGIVYGHVASNVGDLAINHGVAGLLRRVVPDAEVHVVFHNPNRQHLEAAKHSFGDIPATFSELNTRDVEGTRAVRDRASLLRAKQYVRKPLEFLKETGLEGCDAILYNSGEHLFAYRGQDPSMDQLWRVLPALAARAAGIRFITLPATFGPFEDARLSQLFRSFISLNESLAVREPRSAEMVAKLAGAQEPPTLLDPAFFIRAPGVTAPRTNDRTLGIVMRLDSFGLRVGPSSSRETLQGHREEGFRESVALKFSVAAASAYLREVDGFLKLFVQSSGNDRELTLAIAAALDALGHGERLEIMEPVSVDDYLQQLSSVDLVMAARFHACILSAVAGKPCLGIHFPEHGHKMPGLFDLLGVPEYCLTPERDRLESAAEAVVPLFLNREPAFQTVQDTVSALRAQTAEWLHHALLHPGAPGRTDSLREATRVYLRGVRAVARRLPQVPLRTRLTGVTRPRNSRADR